VLRTIIHVDMDAFYASVEQRDDTTLKGLPVVVGGTGPRGVVAAASYEARNYGVCSAMPMSRARKLCPPLKIVPVRMQHYQEVSASIFSAFNEFTPEVEGLSLDEAFLDVTSSGTLFGSGTAIGYAIKERVQQLTGLTCSVGIAPNKLVAKIASDLDKPDGLVDVPLERIQLTLDPLPLAALPGLGPKQRQPLESSGLTRVGDLRKLPPHQLERLVGAKAARRLQRLAAGDDDRPVSSYRRDKSLSAETTFDIDLSGRQEMYRELSKLVDRVASRLRAKGLTATTLALKLRTPDFHTVTRQRRLDNASASTRTFNQVARDLLDCWARDNPGAHLRLLGVGTAGLRRGAEPDLFADSDPGSAVDQLDATGDLIRDRFGSSAVARARQLSSDKSPEPEGTG
jgi:DNA polymerase-4